MYQSDLNFCVNTNNCDARTSIYLDYVPELPFPKRRTILSMMKDSTKSEATKAKITVPELIAGILGIIMIIFGYYISTEMFGKFEVLTMVLVTPFLILFLTVVGLIYSLEVQYLSYLNH